MSFKANVLKLVSSNGLATLIAVLFTPILTRLFNAEAFGIVAVFASVAGIFGAISCLRYEQAIVIAKSNIMALNMMSVSIIIAVATSLIILAIGIGNHIEILSVFGLESLGVFFWLIPFNVMIIGLHSAFNLWNTRHKNFTIISIATITGGLSTTFFNLCFGFAGYTTGQDLVIASVCGQTIAVLIFAVLSAGSFSQIRHRKSRFNRMAFGLKRYKKFPLYSSWAILMGASAWLLPTILMGIFFDAKYVGLYALGFKIIQMPTGLIGSAIGQVFFEASKKAQQTGQLGQTVEDLTATIISLFLFPYMALTLIGAEFYEVVFGVEWWTAGYYSQILAPWAFVWFLSSPLSPLFSLLERQGTQLIWNIFNLLSRLTPIAIAVYFADFALLIWSLGIIGLALYGYKVILSMNIAGASFWNVLKLCRNSLVLCCLAMIILGLFNWLGLHLIWKLLFCASYAFGTFYIFFKRQ